MSVIRMQSNDSPRPPSGGAMDREVAKAGGHSYLTPEPLERSLQIRRESVVAE